MIYINNQTIDKTTDINQIIKAIKALPSPFVNLDEDKVIEDKSLLELLRVNIEVLNNLVEDYDVKITIKCKDLQDIITHYLAKEGFKIFKRYVFRKALKRLKDSIDEQTVDYFHCFSNVIGSMKANSRNLSHSTKLAAFYFKNIHDLSLDKFQGKYDEEAYIVAQGEVGFSSNQKMGTYAFFDCIALVIQDFNSKKTALIHVDWGVTEDHLSNLLKYMPTGSKRVVLMGAQGNGNSQKNLEKIIRALLKYGHNIHINHSNIFCTYGGVTSCIVDPITFKIRYLVPKLEINKEFKLCSQPRVLRIFNNAVHTENDPGYSISFNNRFKDRLEYAFDLDIKESYLPIEICKETANSVFNIIKYMNINNNYPFYSVNENYVQCHVECCVKNAIDNVKNGGQGNSNELELTRVMELYCNALNNLRGAIEEYTSSLKVLNFLKKSFIRNVVEILKTKKIFIGSNSQELNLEFLIFIKSFKLEKLNKEEFELQASKLIDDLKSYQLPFSTDFSDLDRCQKLREFMVRNKNADTSTPSTGLLEVVLPEVPSFICYR
ncbi:hypothetical protein [Candidatus Mesenet endosymbiont of Agriotes lineatus]|uniref:hypothetical protein n=1 Tax=Candidatus Mesenet endosymbiont of Agriotes lineatus TaxID=3077948 RepID=UPI0030D4701F